MSNTLLARFNVSFDQSNSDECIVLDYIVSNTGRYDQETLRRLLILGELGLQFGQLVNSIDIGSKIVDPEPVRFRFIAPQSKPAKKIMSKFVDSLNSMTMDDRNIRIRRSVVLGYQMEQALQGSVDLPEYLDRQDTQSCAEAGTTAEVEKVVIKPIVEPVAEPTHDDNTAKLIGALMPHV